MKTCADAYSIGRKLNDAYDTLDEWAHPTSRDLVLGFDRGYNDAMNTFERSYAKAQRRRQVVVKQGGLVFKLGVLAGELSNPLIFLKRMVQRQPERHKSADDTRWRLYEQGIPEKQWVF